MTNQEAFEKVVARLTDGRGRAMNEHRACMYRAPSGLPCAVGCLIPDEEYRKDLEGSSIMALGNLTLPSLAGLDLYMLAAVQAVHDGYQYWIGKTLNESGIKALQNIAWQYNLTMPEIER